VLREDGLIVDMRRRPDLSVREERRFGYAWVSCRAGVVQNHVVRARSESPG
jgi:transposase